MTLARAQSVSNTDHHLKITRHVNFLSWLAHSEEISLCYKPTTWVF